MSDRAPFEPRVPAHPERPSNVRPLDPDRLARIMGDIHPDLYQIYRARRPKASLFSRIGDALGGPWFFAFYCGFYCGCLATAILALIWSRAL